MAGDEEEKVVPEKGRFKSMLFSLWAGADGGKKKKDEPSDMADELETEEAGEESPEEVAKEKDDNLVPVKNNQLYELYQLQNGLPPMRKAMKMPCSIFLYLWRRMQCQMPSSAIS